MEPMLPEPNVNGGNAQGVPQDGGVASVPPGMAPPPVQPQTPPAGTPNNQAQQAPQQSHSTQGQTGNQPSGAAPLIADDVDVIEKEWVDKAKKIVDATKSDPHQLEKEVSKLQADYLMKRYNKKLKVSE